MNKLYSLRPGKQWSHDHSHFCSLPERTSLALSPTLRLILSEAFDVHGFLPTEDGRAISLLVGVVYSRSERAFRRVKHKIVDRICFLLTTLYRRWQRSNWSMVLFLFDSNPSMILEWVESRCVSSHHRVEQEQWNDIHWHCSTTDDHQTQCPTTLRLDNHLKHEWPARLLTLDFCPRACRSRETRHDQHIACLSLFLSCRTFDSNKWRALTKLTRSFPLSDK